jgi:hypothetical protein
MASPRLENLRSRLGMRVALVLLPMRIEDVLKRVQGEFVEMPGLCLTAAQAQRLWGLDREFCEKLMEALVEKKFLAQRRDGSFIRIDDGPKRMAPRSAA